MLRSKFLDPKNYYAFQRIFGIEKHKDILMHFLNDMLGLVQGEKIQTVSFLKPSQDPDIAYKKQSIVDVLCTDQKEGQYIVELMVAHTTGFEKRAQDYAAKAYVNQMAPGEKYQNIKKITFIAITDFVMFPDIRDYQSSPVVFEVPLGRNFHTQPLKDFFFCFLELPKFNMTIDSLYFMVDKWAYFFKHASQTSEADVEKIAGPDIVIQQAYEALNQFSWSEQELFTYEQQKKSELDEKAILGYAFDQGLEIGLKEGIAKARANLDRSNGSELQLNDYESAEMKQPANRAILEAAFETGQEHGEKRKSLEIAKAMLKANLSVSQICELTGLSEKDLETALD